MTSLKYRARFLSEHGTEPLAEGFGSSRTIAAGRAAEALVELDKGIKGDLRFGGLQLRVDKTGS